MAREMRFRLSVTCYRGNVHAPVHHPLGNSEANSPFGTFGSLDSLFDCPHVVKLTLCDMAGLNSSFLANSEDAVDSIFSNTGIRLLFTPHYRHQKSVSRCVAVLKCRLISKHLQNRVGMNRPDKHGRKHPKNASSA
jgi:hypothetical protein